MANPQKAPPIPAPPPTLEAQLQSASKRLKDAKDLLKNAPKEVRHARAEVMRLSEAIRVRDEDTAKAAAMRLNNSIDPKRPVKIDMTGVPKTFTAESLAAIR